MPLRFQEDTEEVPAASAAAPASAPSSEAPVSAMKKSKKAAPAAKEEPEEEEGTPKSTRKKWSLMGRKKDRDEEEEDLGPSGSRAKSSGHRRVFTKSSQYYAHITVTVVRADDIPGKKGIQPYVQVYLGSSSFATKKKKGNAVEWGEEFEADVDRDDTISYKIWDMAKLERSVDPGKKIEPLCKKKNSLKEFARRGSFEAETQKLGMLGGGTLEVRVTFQVNVPVPGEVHTKSFTYPAWMPDRYGVNQVPPSLDSARTGWTTMARYTSRWLLNQRAIQNALQNPDEEEEEEGDVPEGMQFTLIDISCAAHDKVHQVLVTYTWVQEEVAEADEDALFTRPKILTSKLFSAPTALNKKKQYDGKGHSSGTYQETFEKVSTTMHEVIKMARDWLKENPNGFQEVYKMVPIATPQSHHVLLWYYK